jgi:hypothetical protein
VYPLCTRAVGSFKCAQTITQAQRIELRDREDADAALKAPRLADEKVSAAARRVRKRSIHDLHQRGVIDL